MYFYINIKYYNILLIYKKKNNKKLNKYNPILEFKIAKSKIKYKYINKTITKKQKKKINK